MRNTTGPAFLEPQLTPREIDPPRGWIATANQRIHAPDYPHYLTNEWAVPYRMQRIEQLLAAEPQHDLQSLRRSRPISCRSRRCGLLPFIKQAKSSHPLAASAQARLATFDGTMAGDQPAPLIFWAWARHLTEASFADDLGGPAAWRGALGGRSYRDALEGVLERNDARWCDDQSTAAVVETCAQQIDSAFTKALDELQAAQGSDVAAWRWDRAHIARRSTGRSAASSCWRAGSSCARRSAATPTRSTCRGSTCAPIRPRRSSTSTSTGRACVRCTTSATRHSRA
jgi:penicillin amidase